MIILMPNQIADRFQARRMSTLFSSRIAISVRKIPSPRVGKAFGKPVLLWGPRDEAPLEDGMRGCAIRSAGSSRSGKVLRRFNVPFTYVTNCRVDDPLFERGFTNFIAAARMLFGNSAACGSCRSARVPSSFWTMMCNEGELLEAVRH